MPRSVPFHPYSLIYSMDFCEASLECHHSSNSPQLSHNGDKSRVSKKRNLVMAADAKTKAKTDKSAPARGAACTAQRRLVERNPFLSRAAQALRRGEARIMIRVSAAQLKESMARGFVHHTLPAARCPFTVDGFLSP
jgi:hypothetical protein